MNPDTNRFEQLTQEEGAVPGPNRAERRMVAAIERTIQKATGRLLRPNGEPVPEHWSRFQVGEHIVIKDYTFKVAYVGETSILFEPVGPILVGQP